jgi:phosphatidate cytidylyltransferase
VLIPLVIIPTLLGHEWFVGLIVGVAAAAAWELTALQRRAGYAALPPLAAAIAVALPLAAVVELLPLGWMLLAAVGAIVLFVLGYALKWHRAIAGVALSLAAGLYPGVLFGPAVTLRERADGLGWILLIMLATWACDTTAFFVGRQWGRHKLAPAVSPGKTVEGLAAGLLGGLVVGAAASMFLTEAPVRMIGLGLVVAVASVLGDLVESAMKRQLGAKDSGWLVPGHGGLLDRIDSLLFSAFLGYLYITLTDGVFRA